MRHTVRPLCVVAMLAGLTSLAATPTVQAQTTQPASSTILVLPFTAPSGSNDAWIGKAVQQDLLADLSQGTDAHVIAPAAAPAAADQDAALGTARQMGASTVIYGQAQMMGKDVRLSGQVLDVATGKPLGAVKSTGPTDELFHLEDALAGQVFMALPKELLSARTKQGMQDFQARQAQQQQQQQPATQGQWPNGPYANPTLNSDSIYGNSSLSQPAAVAPQAYDGGSPYTVYTEPTPVYNYNYYYPADSGYYGYANAYGNGYGYGYGYPGWGWGGWPWWGPTFFFSNNFHNHGFDHGHEHGDFNHHWNGGNGSWNHGSWNHGTTGTGSAFAHSNFGAGVPRGNTGFRAGPRVSTGGFGSASRFGSAGFRSGGFRGGLGGSFHGAAGGFHGGFGGFHAAGGFGGGHAGGFGGGGHGGGGGGGGHR